MCGTRKKSDERGSIETEAGLIRSPPLSHGLAIPDVLPKTIKTVGLSMTDLGPLFASAHSPITAGLFGSTFVQRGSIPRNRR